MTPLITSVALVVSLLSIGANSQVNYTDTHVLPTPHKSYARYLTFFGVGSRTYTCDPASGNDTYTLTDLNYNLYPAEPVIDLTTLVGRRVYLPKVDYNGGDFAFYTKIGAFTYWVGKVVQTHDDPASTGPLDLPEDLEIVTERSEPKPYQTDLDLGVANFVTRFGAVGGALPEGLKCTDATKTVVSNGTNFYSFWKRTM